MLNIIWGISLWALVLLLIPIERLREIWKVGVIATLWLFVVDFTFINLGYYEFKPAISIAGIPLFYLLGGAAGGILLLNWFPREPLYKVIFILAFSGLIRLSEELFITLGYFRYLNNFTPLLSFTLNIAGLSLLVWYSFALLGEEEIYRGSKSRFSREF